jgi:hypothetical protein
MNPILWQPIETADKEADPILLAVPNKLGSAQGGDGKKLNPRWPVIYYLATWDESAGQWRTTEDDRDGYSVYLTAREPRSWARIVPPDWAAAPPAARRDYLALFSKAAGKEVEAIKTSVTTEADGLVAVCELIFADGPDQEIRMPYSTSDIDADAIFERALAKITGKHE